MNVIARRVLEGPSHARRRQAEGRGLRKAQDLVRRHQPRQLLADAEVERIASGKNDYGAPPAPQYLGERPIERARPG